MRIYIYTMSSSPDGEGLFFDEPITEIKFMMKHESTRNALTHGRAAPHTREDQVQGSVGATCANVSIPNLHHRVRTTQQQ